MVWPNTFMNRPHLLHMRIHTPAPLVAAARERRVRRAGPSGERDMRFVKGGAQNGAEGDFAKPDCARLDFYAPDAPLAFPAEAGPNPLSPCQEKNHED